MTEHESSDGLADIAIVGMAGRFPGAGDVAAFWRNLRAGVESIRFFGDEELLEAGVDPRLLEDPSYVKAHGWLDGIDQFDPAFFDINAREAEVTDPQQRFFLECAWEALEDAGYDPQRFAGAIGVFAGTSNNAYVIDNLIRNPVALEAVGHTLAALGNHTDFLATKTAYKLDLRGPALTVQTACSTSLVAIHLACQSLLSGECDMALSGGVCINTLTKRGYVHVDGGTNTPDGHVRTFDARGGGMLGGNAVGIVVLKRLEDALAHGDAIRAVIKGSAINNDGVHKVSFTAPSVEGQAQVIADALEVSGVDPATITMVEAHGTATPLGDPIEVAALCQAWRPHTRATGYCAIGSVKTNVGHLDIAAGVTGVIKTALALRQREIPPSLHFETPNPEIDFAASPFFVNTSLRPWEGTTPRRAAVSSFGMGGTNAHAILEEAPEPGPTTPARPFPPVLVSARSAAALDAATERLAAHLEEHGELELADVAHTTHVGRRAFPHRRAVVARDTAEAAAALRTRDRKRCAEGLAAQAERPVAFLFSGQGAQYPGMMRGLYEGDADFRAGVDRSCELLEPHLALDLRRWLFPAPADEEAAAHELEKTQHTQPALFVVEHALARLWQRRGVEPSAMLGHSIGEYVAACLAGVFSVEDALALVAARGRLIGELPAGGAMLAVHLSEAEVTPLLGSELSLAAINAPELCVVSGPGPAIDVLERALEPRQVATRRLHTSHAFHSALMEPMLDAFRQVVASVTLQAPRARVVSCSTGTWLTDAQATDPAYWVRHVRDAVRFRDGVATLLEGHVLLEVGPGQSLSTLARLSAGATPVVTSTRHPREAGDDSAILARALGELWASGAGVDWERFHGGERRRRVPLPTYPFEHRRYWIDPADGGATLAPPPSGARRATHAGRSDDVGRWFYAPSWRQTPRNAAPRPTGQTWLVFADAAGSELAASVCARLAEEGRGRVLVVEPGDAFRRLGDERFQLRPGAAEDYASLIQALEADGHAPREVLHLWSLADGEADALVERGFFSLLFLGQALSACQAAQGIHVSAVSAGMHDVSGHTTTRPEKAMLVGPCKSITFELADVTCRSIDVDPSEPADDLARRILDEHASEASEVAVALHGPRRWVIGYEPVALPPAPRDAGGCLREGAVVLVTGGLGGIGSVLAEELARSVGARLVLTARTAPPPREHRDAWLRAHGEDDATSRKIRQLQRLEELGSEVLALAADTTDEVAMRDVVARARERFGALDGVIHAAGLVGAGIVATKTREEAERVLAPKVRGTRVLLEALADAELDLVVLVSSISSATSVVAGVDYAAANAYLDAVANDLAKRAPGTRVLAVDFDTWRDVGIATHGEVPEAMRQRHEESLAAGIAPAEGHDALWRALASPFPQLYVSPLDLAGRDDLAAALPGEDPGAAPGTGTVRGASSRRQAQVRPALSTEYVAPESETERTIAAIWGDLLGIDGLGARDNFFELGGNSLVMMQLNVRLRSEYGIALPIRELFDAPEVASLAERIDSVRAISDAGTPGGTSDEEIEEFTL